MPARRSTGASAVRLISPGPGRGISVDRNHDDDHQRRHRNDEQFQQEEARIADRVLRRPEREEPEDQRNRVCYREEEDGQGCGSSELAVLSGETFVHRYSTPFIAALPVGGIGRPVGGPTCSTLRCS